MPRLNELTKGVVASDETMPMLLSIATELEIISARTNFRFGATAPCDAIFMKRIESLRESRFNKG